jgi:protein-disulfide isomerase
MIFVLVPNEVLVYAPTEDTVMNRIPVADGFDRLTHSAKNNTLILTNSAEKKLEIIQLAEVHDISVSGLAFEGPADAPVTIAVFSDYQCPYCARLLPLMEQVREKYPDDVKIVFKNFPLAMHKSAKEAARAVLAAKEQGKFWELHDALFENYRGLNDEKIREIAKDVGLDVEKLEEDMKDPFIEDLINRDIRNAREAGVRGTPTIFVNGVMVKNRSLDGFSEMIENELAKKE